MATARAAPGFGSDRWWRQAQEHLVHGRIDEARQMLARLRVRDGGVYAPLLAAQIAWREDRVRDAANHALDAVAMAPDDNEALCAIANVLLEAGETVAARDALDRCLLAECRSPRLLMQVATLRRKLQQPVEALALLDQASAFGNVSPPLRFFRGEVLVVLGRLEEAESEFSGSLADAPDRGRVAVPLVRLRQQTAERNPLPALEAGARTARPGSIDEAAFEFARYKTLEDLGRDDDAWEALAHGNALMRTRLRDAAAQHHEWLERYLAAWPTVATLAAAEPPRGPMPIFIVGVARSGTTLLERMLGNHSRVAVAGELTDFGSQLHWSADTRNAQTDALLSRLPGIDYDELGRRYLDRVQWRSQGKDFFIDKQPPNWVLVPAIHRALPRAPILNLMRDPMDVCFSNWRAWFGDACAYSYGLAELAEFFIDYRRTMARWHRSMPGAILDVHYAELVRDPEATLQRVFEFCGLEWEPDCTDISRNTAPSATLSAIQVRGGLRRDTSGQWRHYARQLQPLADSLAASV